MKPNVFIICTGVGHINRGYESFTIECFEQLRPSSNFELHLLKGGGRSLNGEIKIACIKRNTNAANFFSKILGKDKYWIEQFTFLVGMLPALIRYKPKVIYYSDFILGTFLFHLRRFLKFKYKLLFSNGAPNGPPYKTEDHIQQLLQVYFDKGILGGTPHNKQTLLPYGFDINVDEPILEGEEKVIRRNNLGLPPQKKIIISVGAVNSGHKRMDYVVREFAKLDQNEYFLILLGQIDATSADVLALVDEKLNPDSYLIKQVSATEVPLYLSVSDYFILASLHEGFGRVLIEAVQYGLLPIVHDYPVVHEVLKHCAVYVDMTKDGVLTNSIDLVDLSELTKQELKSYAYNEYSWDKLIGGYEHMIVNLL